MLEADGVKVRRLFTDRERACRRYIVPAAEMRRIDIGIVGGELQRELDGLGSRVIVRQKIILAGQATGLDVRRPPAWTGCYS